METVHFYHKNRFFLVEKVIQLGFRSRAKDSLAVLERIPFPQNMRIKRAWCKRHDGIFESFKNPDMLK